MSHTKRRIEMLLAGAGVAPRHKWGQNFLIDLNLMRLLVDAAGLCADDTVLEVGCGTGSMTEMLAERAGAVIAVDIDPALAKIANEETADYDNVTVICGDVLATKNAINSDVLEHIGKARREGGGRLLLVANLPYDVAAPVMMNLLAEELSLEGMYVTVQAEVAGRMVAGPGSKAYGPLGILLQATGDVRLLRKRIRPSVFWPMPKVDSAMVAWQANREQYAKINDVQRLKGLVNMILGQRRKTIRNCLAAGGYDDAVIERVLAKVGIDPGARGETVGVDRMVELAKTLP